MFRLNRFNHYALNLNSSKSRLNDSNDNFCTFSFIKGILLTVGYGVFIPQYGKIVFTELLDHL